MWFSRLIVNADDFGYSEEVNRAILSGFESSLLTSTSIMANMPGFDDAVGLVRRHTLLAEKVGLHLNLTEGFPLSRTLMAFPGFCGEGGRFVYHRNRSLFRLNRNELAAVYDELRMQMERVLAAGIRPTHLDSHHHVHTEWAIAPLVCRLARSYGIRRIRLTRNMGLVPSRAKRLYKKFFNLWILGRHTGLVDNTDYFGDLEDMNYFLNSAGGVRDLSFEIMVHPLFDPTGRLVDLDGGDLRERLLPFTPIVL
jgi:chitin disaccharide deacetylase